MSPSPAPGGERGYLRDAVPGPAGRGALAAHAWAVGRAHSRRQARAAARPRAGRRHRRW